jgi:hypothetical protein
MRAVLAALLSACCLVGCTQGTGVVPSIAPSATIAPPTPTADASTPSPTASPTPAESASPAPATEYTADDEAIATLIRAGADEAIPELKSLNDMDPSQLEDQFLPLGDWLTSQKTGLEAYTASSCTAPAVAKFTEGLNRYDAIRKKFLAWRDWGAQGHAFPVAAPGQAVLSFEAAVAELEAHCPE